MSGIAITIDIRDQVTPELRRVAGGLAASKIAAPVGQGVTHLFQAHFTALNSARANPLGGARTNFYARAVRSTSWQPAADGVTISVNSQGIAQRFFGGNINAKPGGALTIPADPEAYGKRAREFNDLKLVVFKDSAKAALVKAMATNIRIGKRGVRAVSSQIERVMYWLVKSVHQKPDPTVLPNDQAITGAAMLAVRSYVAGLLGQSTREATA